MSLGAADLLEVASGLYSLVRSASLLPGRRGTPWLVSSYRGGYTVVTMTVKTRIVQIGNSRGIRIPKILLDRAGLPEDVELYAERGKVVVSAPRHPRRGWAAAAKRMAGEGGDQLIDAATSTRFDREDWEWR